VIYFSDSNDDLAAPRAIKDKAGDISERESLNELNRISQLKMISSYQTRPLAQIDTPLQ